MPALLIHGGAVKREGGTTSEAQYADVLRRLVTSGYQLLHQSAAVDCVVHVVAQLEDEPIFNAGLGSRVQRDGQIRMSAALVDSEHRRFTGVVNIRNVKNPILVAERLRSEKHCVLGGDEATEFAYRNGFTFFDPMTPMRWAEHRAALAGETGTVGVVALDRDGRICAGTSTGGVGNETAGRISDSATVAGVYARGEWEYPALGRAKISSGTPSLLELSRSIRLVTLRRRRLRGSFARGQTTTRVLR